MNGVGVGGCLGQGVGVGGCLGQGVGGRGWWGGVKQSTIVGSALGGVKFGIDQILAHLGWVYPSVIWDVAILSDSCLSILGP